VGSMQAKVFISYAREDSTTVNGLANDLRTLRHQPFYDLDLAGGHAWWDALLSELETAHVFMPVLTNSFRLSRACKVETEYAAELGLPFLPVQLEPVENSLFVPRIRDAQWVSYDAQSRNAVLMLSRAMSDLPEPLPVDRSTVQRPAPPQGRLDDVQARIGDYSSNLSLSDQQGFVFRLGDLLGGPEDVAARTLLHDLRERPDVLAQIEHRIDQLLDEHREGSRPSGPQVSQASQVSQVSQVSQALPVAVPTGVPPTPPVQTVPTHGPPAGSPGLPPQNYMWLGVLSTLFCCFALGIPSIVFAAQVNSKWRAGDLAGAQVSAKRARTYGLVSVGVGVVFWTVMIILSQLYPDAFNTTTT
jgi:hypothetical protein